MIDPAWIPRFDPPDEEPERSDYADAGLIDRAETERLLALYHLHRARACLGFLANALRTDPTAGGDAEADAWADLFDKECVKVGQRIAGLREFRECRGRG